jgi:hypothetical protein
VLDKAVKRLSHRHEMRALDRPLPEPAA